MRLISWHILSKPWTRRGPNRLPIKDEKTNKNYLVANSVKGLLKINKDYTIKNTSTNIDTPAIVCLQQGGKSVV